MLSRFSVEKPYTVIVGVILALVLGVISFMQMTTDLLPELHLPDVMVMTSYPGASPEQVEKSVTRPLESSMATTTDLKKITSTSNESYSLVVLQFNSGTNMDTVMIELNSKVNQVSAGWSDEIGAPTLFKINPNMLPVVVAAVDMEGSDIISLSDYVE